MPHERTDPDPDPMPMSIPGGFRAAFTAALLDVGLTVLLLRRRRGRTHTKQADKQQHG